MMKMSQHQIKIIILWVVFLLGTLFHTQLGLMPLFHGLNIAEARAQSVADISWILWLMLGFFMIPMGAIVATGSTTFSDSGRYRTFHFGITVLYSILNLLHVVMDLLVQPIIWPQIALMVILLGIGLLLNVVAFQWMQIHPRRQKWQRKLMSSH